MLTSEDNEAQEVPGKYTGHAEDRSDSPFGLFPHPNLLFFSPFHAAPRRT